MANLADEYGTQEAHATFDLIDLAPHTLELVLDLQRVVDVRRLRQELLQALLHGLEVREAHLEIVVLLRHVLRADAALLHLAELLERGERVAEML